MSSSGDRRQAPGRDKPSATPRQKIDIDKIKMVPCEGGCRKFVRETPDQPPFCCLCMMAIQAQEARAIVANDQRNIERLQHEARIGGELKWQRNERRKVMKAQKAATAAAAAATKMTAKEKAEAIRERNEKMRAAAAAGTYQGTAGNANGPRIVATGRRNANNAIIKDEDDEVDFIKREEFDNDVASKAAAQKVAKPKITTGTVGEGTQYYAIIVDDILYVCGVISDDEAGDIAAKMLGDGAEFSSMKRKPSKADAFKLRDAVVAKNAKNNGLVKQEDEREANGGYARDEVDARHRRRK